MKKRLPQIGAILLSLILCVFFGNIFLTYTKPMKDQMYDFSIQFGDELAPWDGDEKGWTVFTQEGDTVTKLSPNEFGAYTGLSYPGQTFYYSRVLNENVDSPSLSIGAVHRNIVVYLDNSIIYSDCPDIDNRIGHMQLPMREYDLNTPLVITLSENYVGKTLTIAQSTDTAFDGSPSRIEAIPCPVFLYCNYAYESSLISESFQTAIFMTCIFIIGLLILFIFIRQVFHREPNAWFMVCIAFIVFLWMLTISTKVSFHLAYSILQEKPIIYTCNYLITACLLLFLASKAGRYKYLLYAISIADLIMSAINYIFLSDIYGALSNIPSCIGLFGILFSYTMTFLFWRKETHFYRFFFPLSTIGIIGYIFLMLYTPAARIKLFSQLQVLCNSLSADYFTNRLTYLFVIIATLLTFWEFVKQELNRHTEKQLLKEQYHIIQTSYDNLRQHNEQVMMLRHDLNKHLTVLREMSDLQQINTYLDEVIGEKNNIRPLIQSNNEMLNIILNGKLSLAQDAGIALNLHRIQIPEKLPLSDSDLCSLFMNILENAVTASSKVATQQAYITLDMHIKDDFWVISCENAKNEKHPHIIHKKETVPTHGFGLKIIRQIAERYHILLNTEYDAHCYKIILAVPLHQASK